MDEARQIVLQALERAGLPLPSITDASHDLSPSALVAVSFTALALIRGEPSSPPPPLPETMSDRVRICNELASAIMELGYTSEINFHQFLYPTEDDTHKLLRFLVEKLSTSTTTSRRVARIRGNSELIEGSESTSKDVNTDVSNYLMESRHLDEETSDTKNDDHVMDDVASAAVRESNIGPPMGTETQKDYERPEPEEKIVKPSDAEKDLKETELSELEEVLASVSAENSKLKKDIIDLEESIATLDVEYGIKSKQLETMRRHRSILKSAKEMGFDLSNIDESNLQQLLASLEDGQPQNGDLCAKMIKDTDVEKISSSTSEDLETQSKHLKETREQIKDLTAKLNLRQEQLASLSVQLENVGKGSSRESYTRRITELIKNSKKQDIDISNIIGQIRDLQREMNSNQGRLKRTYALVDEIMFREAKKDPLCRQAYRLLARIHQDFSDCYDKVFAIDKVKREITELQATIESLEKQPVDLKKVQSDLNALIAENVALQKSINGMSIKS